MIKEELYVINENGEKYELDLPSPSGITLKWVSNLFSDISKLTCSYSYTFKLPMTANNRRILDIVEDIRHDSSFARVVVDAEFFVNGICLCPNANLYVSEIASSSFSCIMTWKVLKAFEELKSDSLNINELPSIGTFTWKTGDSDLMYGFPTHASKNTDNILYPNYDAGLPYEDGTPPKPVVPIYRLMQLINEYYGTKIEIGHKVSQGMGLLPKADFNNKDYYGKYVYDDYATYGVLPITGMSISSDTQSRYTITEIKGDVSDRSFDCGYKVLYGIYEKWAVTASSTGAQDSISVKEYIRDYDMSNWHRYGNLGTFSFNGNKYIKNTGYKISSTDAGLSEDESKYLRSLYTGNQNYYTRWDIYECKGQYKVSYKNEKNDKYYIATSKAFFTCSIECELRGEAEVRVSKADIKDGKAVLKDYWWIYILQIKQGEDDEEISIETYSEESDDWMGLRSISREETSTEYVYKFDFGVKYDVRKLTIDAAEDDEVGLCFWSGTYEEGWSKTEKDEENDEEKITETGVNYTNTATFSYLRIKSITPKVDFEGLPAEMDIIGNLPEISCFDFVKNLFFMNGALPRVEKDGETISAMYYNQLRDRVVSGDCLDWSNKMLSANSENSSSIKTYNSNFGRENYFLMAKNEKETTDEEKLEELELYGDGYGKIVIDDKRLDEEKTVFTSVFYPGLRSDLAYPNVFTGRTMKVWDGEKNVQSEVNPIIGYLNYRALDSTIEDMSDVEKRPMIKTYGVDFKHIRMNTFEPFADMDEFYGYLKSILEDYAVIKEKFILNEFDLANFDESIPIYLHKYNCCFAVSTIQRDKNGISTVELVKLPYVKATYPTPEENEAEKVSYNYVLSSCISIKLNLERNYTSNETPLQYEDFRNNQYVVTGSSGHSTIYIPCSDSSKTGPYNYISRIVVPYEANKLKGDSYYIEYEVRENASYVLRKLRGVDVIYEKTLKTALRVYYDDVRCDVGTHKVTFSKNDFGSYHVFKFIFDIYNAEGEKVEQVRKKMYYFVSDVDESVITDDFGDTHEEDNSEKVNDVTIEGSESIADMVAHKYTMSYTPWYAQIGVKSVNVSVDSSSVSSIRVYNVTTSGFTLSAQNLPEMETPVTISVNVTLTDGTSFVKTKVIFMVQPTLILRGNTYIESENGTATATYKVAVNPYGAWCTINSISSEEDNVSIDQNGPSSFKIVVSNVTEDTTAHVAVTAEYEGITMSNTFAISVRYIDKWSVALLDNAGLLIVDRNGKFYTYDEWKASGIENEDADGVAVSDGTHRFIVSKKNFAYGNTSAGSTIIDGQTSANEKEDALEDYDGKKNTDAVLNALSDSFASEIRQRKDFPSGKEEYCPSLGEWKIAGNKRLQINNMLTLIGGDTLYESSNNCDYLSSTRKGDNGKWFAHFGANIEYTSTSFGQVQGRGFAEVPENTIPVNDGYMSVLGDDSFKTKNGVGEAIYTVSYGPEGVSTSEVTMESSNEDVILTKISDTQFKLSATNLFTDASTIVTIKARLNGLMRKGTKNISIVGETVIDYDKLDEAKALILCTDYSLYTAEEWSTSGRNKSDVEGVAVSDGTHRIIVAMDDTESCYFGGDGKEIEDLSNDTRAYNGKENTSTIVKNVTSTDGYFSSSPYSAAGVAMKYVFPSGKSGFMASCAEWRLVDNNYSLVESLITTVGGTTLVKSGSYNYWVSTKGIDKKRAYIYHSFKTDAGVHMHNIDSYAERTRIALVRPFRNF